MTALRSPRRGAALLVFALAAAAQAELPPITELVPDSTIVVAGIENGQQTIERLQRTGLWDLWQSEEMEELRTEVVTGFEDGVEEMINHLGIDREKLQLPTGAIGMALFNVPSEQMNLPGFGMMIAADYGEHADGMEEFFRAAFRESADEMTTEEREVMGRTVIAIQMNDVPEPVVDEFAPPAPEMILANMMREIYFVREKSAFMLCTDMETLSKAFEVCDGATSRGLAENEHGQAIMSSIGHNDAYMMVLTSKLGGLISTVDQFGMMAMVGPMAKQFIGDVQGIGIGYQLDSERAMVEGTAYVHMPNGKSGLSELVSHPAPRGTVPSFVGADTVTYMRMNFDFASLPALVEGVLNAIGPFLPMGMGPEGAAAQVDMIKQVTSCFGDEIHIAQTVKRPITATSMGSVVAIECTKPEDFDNFLGMIAPQMGADPRDFQGHRIYTVEGDAMAAMGGMPMMPMGGGDLSQSIGIGGGWVFLGPTVGVEQSLRTVGQDEPAGIVNPSFERAMNAFRGDDLIGWGYTDLVESMEAQTKVTALQQQAIMEEFAEDPAFAEDLAEMEIEDPMAALGAIDYDLLRRYIGPTSWEASVTEGGFLVRSYILSAAPAE